MKTREDLIEVMAKASKQATIDCYNSKAEPFNPDFADRVHLHICNAVFDALLKELPEAPTYDDIHGPITGISSMKKVLAPDSYFYQQAWQQFKAMEGK